MCFCRMWGEVVERSSPPNIPRNLLLRSNPTPPPPPPLYKLRPCPSYSRRRDRNNGVRNFNCARNVVRPHKTWVCRHICQLHGAMGGALSAVRVQCARSATIWASSRTRDAYFEILGAPRGIMVTPSGGYARRSTFGSRHGKA